jgi:hypothetical protein
MGSLVEVLKDPTKRTAVLDDCEILLNAEVSSKRGLTGVGVKAAFKALKAVKPGMIRHTLDDLVDELAAKVDPFWIQCQEQSANPQTFFTTNKVAIANALLGITDGRAERSKFPTIVRAYKTLRPKAIQYIGDAMPRFSQLVSKHAS